MLLERQAAAPRAARVSVFLYHKLLLYVIPFINRRTGIEERERERDVLLKWFNRNHAEVVHAIKILFFLPRNATRARVCILCWSIPASGRFAIIITCEAPGAKTPNFLIFQYKRHVKRNIRFDRSNPPFLYTCSRAIKPKCGRS